MREHWWLPRELSCFNGRSHLKVRGEPAAKQFITVRRLEIYALPASTGEPRAADKSQEDGQTETQAFQK